MTFEEMETIQKALCTGYAAVEILGETQRQRWGRDYNPKQEWADQVQAALDLLREVHLRKWRKEVLEKED